MFGRILAMRNGRKPLRYQTLHVRDDMSTAIRKIAYEDGFHINEAAQRGVEDYRSCRP